MAAHCVRSCLPYSLSTKNMAVWKHWRWHVQPLQHVAILSFRLWQKEFMQQALPVWTGALIDIIHHTAAICAILRNKTLCENVSCGPSSYVHNNRGNEHGNTHFQCFAGRQVWEICQRKGRCHLETHPMYLKKR